MTDYTEAMERLKDMLIASMGAPWHILEGKPMSGLLTDDQLLQKSILLNPHDDAPRLQYADWLEEHDGYAKCPKCNGRSPVESVYGYSLEFVVCSTCDGKSEVSNNYSLRAEFIRLQMRDHKASAKTDRELEYGHGFRFKWFPVPFDAKFSVIEADDIHDGNHYSCCVVKRGFIDEIHCTMDEFMTHGKAIARQHPVTKWVITDVAPWVLIEKEVCWWDSEVNPKNGELPNRLFKHLRSGESFYRTRHYSRGETGKQEAVADLEQACFHFAREGLEDHVPPPTSAIL